MGVIGWLLRQAEHKWHLALLKRRDPNPHKYAIQEQPDFFPSDCGDILIVKSAAASTVAAAPPIEIVTSINPIKITVTKSAQDTYVANSHSNAKLTNLCTLFTLSYNSINNLIFML